MVYLLIIAISLLPLTALVLNYDLLHTHDGLVHLPRIAAYFKALMDGQFPVRFAGELNYGYGMPLFNFIYQLPYMISSLFLVLGVSLVASFKLALSLSFLLSGIFMFMFGKAFFNDSQKALLVTVFYQFAPFRLIELLTRGSFGEVYTYVFLPLTLLGLITLFKKPGYLPFMLTTISSALLILSHNSVSLLFFGVAVLFTLFFASKKRNLFLGSMTLLLGLALAAFYWVPAMLEHKFTFGDLFMKDLYLEHFGPVQNFFIPNIFNSEAFQIGGISVQIGLFHLLGSMLALFVMKKKIERRILIFCYVLIAGSFFFMLPISKIFWETISFLRQFQFPWRFLSVIVFATSLLSVSFLTLPLFKKKVWYALLLFLVILSTVNYWKPQQGFDKIDESYYWNFPLNTTYYGETDVIWSAGPAKAYPASRIEIISGEGTVANFAKKSNLQTFTIDAKTKVSVVSHTQYFPGWRVYVDGKETDIQFQDANWRGLVTFEAPEGTHIVRIAFEETKLRLAADIISLSSLGFLLFLGIPKVRTKYEKY